MSESLHVLVVDDEPAILQSCSRVLERAGHQVRSSESARAALSLFEREAFDLIVTDIMMPDIGGLEFIQQIKERAPAATIVVVTGYGTIETATEALRRGASGFLTKPFTPGELRAAVSDAFARGRATEEAIRTKAYEPLALQAAGTQDLEVPADVLTLLTQSTRRATGADLAVIAGPAEPGHPALLAVDSLKSDDRDSLSPQFLADLVAAATESDNGIVWPDYREDAASRVAKHRLLGPQVRALLGVAVRLADDTRGILAIARRSDPRPFTEGDLALLRIQASQVTALFERERLHGELNTAYLGVVLSLANALEARDAYTGGHCERMAELGSRLAAALDLGAIEVEAIRLGGILHDIGKIGVPDAILLKAGALSDDERTLIQQHTEIGFQIVEPVKGLHSVLPIIRHHHERYDGRGYPIGLSGAAIPIGARILGVCDAYEAMNSTRPYREALPRRELLTRLRAGSGTQFDPLILAAFFDLLR